MCYSYIAMICDPIVQTGLSWTLAYIIIECLLSCFLQNSVIHYLENYPVYSVFSSQIKWKTLYTKLIRTTVGEKLNILFIFSVMGCDWETAYNVCPVYIMYPPVLYELLLSAFLGPVMVFKSWFIKILS